MKNYYIKTTVLLATFLFASLGFAQTYSDGIFVLNEGLAGTSTASVSYLDTDGNVENDVFSTQNQDIDLGNTAQGMGFNEDYAYIVLNGSQEVKVVDKSTFELVTNITDQMVNPRYIAFSNGKGYVTNWGDPTDTEDDYVAVFDLATNIVTGTIPVAEGPENIIEKSGKLYVAHQGGYGFGNTVSVIDEATETVESIEVGDVPSALKIDQDNLYVLCSGSPSYAEGGETTGALYKIDLTDYQNINEYTFEGVKHPAFLGLDDTNVYYTLSSNVYQMALDATELPSTPYIVIPNSVSTPYAFNKIDDHFYFADANGYTSDGKVLVYDEEGTLENEFNVGALPNGFYQNDAFLEIPDFNTNSISLYPNPATESFTISNSEKAIVSLYDLSGRMVKEVNFNQQRISLDGLTSGIYLVRIEVAETITTKKLIVQ